MATASTYSVLTDAKGSSAGGGWFKRFLTNIAKGQELRAQRLVCDHFRLMDTRTLQSYGFTAKDIERLRRGEIVQFPE